MLGFLEFIREDFKINVVKETDKHHTDYKTWKKHAKAAGADHFNKNGHTHVALVRAAYGGAGRRVVGTFDKKKNKGVTHHQSVHKYPE